MQRPTPEVMYGIKETFDFLKRENHLRMIPIFQTTQTFAVHMYIDEVGALYGLILHNPKLVITLALSALKKDKKPFGAFILKYGFEHVWKTNAEKENLNVRFQTDIIIIWQREECSVVNWRHSWVGYARYQTSRRPGQV
jgi:hypothetical protein